jgi:ribosome modulation factor
MLPFPAPPTADAPTVERTPADVSECYWEGVSAAYERTPMALCPYAEGPKRKYWRDGYRLGALARPRTETA